MPLQYSLALRRVSRVRDKLVPQQGKFFYASWLLAYAVDIVCDLSPQLCTNHGERWIHPYKLN